MAWPDRLKRPGLPREPAVPFVLRATESPAKGALVVFLAYLLAGQAASWLVIRPGYASAIWPAAGVALLGALLVGWRGCLAAGFASFLLNLNLGSGNADNAAGLAFGVFLQALWGGFLVRQVFSGPPDKPASATVPGLPRPRLLGSMHWSVPSSVAHFIMVGGFAGCLVAPTFSLLVLTVTGGLQGDPLMGHWMTWWLGDAVGVVVVTTPLLMLWDAGLAHYRRTVLLLTQIGMLLSLGLLLSFLRYQDASRSTDRLQGQAELVSQAIQKQVEQTMSNLTLLAMVAEAESGFDLASFGKFATGQLARRGVLSLDWAPFVPGRELLAFERKVRSTSHPNFTVHQHDSTGLLIPVRPASSYLPILYSVPGSGQKALGFDLTSDEIRRAAVRQAMISRKPTATEPTTLIRHQPVPGFLVAVPAFRQTRFLGVVLGVFSTTDLLEGALVGVDTEGSNLRLVDVTGRSPVLLCQRGEAEPASKAIEISENVRFAGRSWEVRLTAASGRPGHPLETLALPTILLIFSSLLTSLVVTGAARTEEVERLVAQRTVDLSQEIAERVAVESQLRQADRVKSQFLANMSHELRTPLNAIIGFSELLQDESFGKLNSKQQRYVSHVLHSAQHLLALINDVLDLTKIESGEMSLHRESLSAERILDEALSCIRLAASQKEISLGVEIPSDLLDGWADPVKLRQIFLNLLSNAVKFTPSGGQIQVAIEAQGPDLLVSISDNGIGLASTDLERVFESFIQVDSSYSRQQEGTGLGLSLSRQLVELHGGKLWVESPGLGQGSTFYVLLPFGRADANCQEPESEPRKS